MNKTGKNTAVSSSSDGNKLNESQLPLAKINFVLMGVSVALIILGFLLMLGSESTTDAFNPDIFSTRRIIVGPTIAFIGFVAMGVSIIYRPRRR